MTYRSGKKNPNDDSLSCYPTSSEKDDKDDATFGILAMLSSVEPEGSLIGKQQREDPELLEPRVHNKRREGEYLTSMIWPNTLHKVMT